MARAMYREAGKRIAFWCPACDIAHAVRVVNDPTADHHIWEFNGDVEAPTLLPSVLIRYPVGKETRVCHFDVFDGRIRYAPDSTHELRGQTVDLPEFTP